VHTGNARENEMADRETAAAFLDSRRDWMRVQVVPGWVGGQGWDVVLRIDGTYGERVDAERVAAAMKRKIESLSDITHDRWDAWDAKAEG
jgi:hypothetical protein